MDYDESGSARSQNTGYTEDGEEFGPPVRQPRLTVNLSWQQIAFILTVNAILSLIISVVVVIIAGPRLPARPEVTGPPVTEVSQVEQPPPVGEGVQINQGGSPSVGTPVVSGDAAISGARPMPSEAPPAETPEEPTIYVVQPGDTLGNIARRFEVSLEDLMQANGIVDPDYVQIGQRLLIPIGGLPVVTPTFTPVPVPTDTPLPFSPPTPLPPGNTPPAEPAATVGPTSTPVPTLPSAAENEIRLVLQALSPGDPLNEMIQIVNQGPFVRLTAWTLSDEAGNVYVFPDFSLWGGGAVNIHTTGGSNTTTDLYWGQPASVWNVGELATLRDAGGKVIVTYVVTAP